MSNLIPAYFDDQPHQKLGTLKKGEGAAIVPAASSAFVVAPAAFGKLVG